MEADTQKVPDPLFLKKTCVEKRLDQAFQTLFCQHLWSGEGATLLQAKYLRRLSGPVHVGMFVILPGIVLFSCPTSRVLVCVQKMAKNQGKEEPGIFIAKRAKMEDQKHDGFAFLPKKTLL